VEAGQFLSGFKKLLAGKPPSRLSPEYCTWMRACRAILASLSLNSRDFDKLDEQLEQSLACSGDMTDYSSLISKAWALTHQMSVKEAYLILSEVVEIAIENDVAFVRIEALIGLTFLHIVRYELNM